MSNFSNLIKKTYVYNRKAVLLTVGAVLLGCIILGTAMGLLGNGGSTGEVVCYYIIASIISTAVASMAFVDFKTKAGKINILMTPATAFEKFAVRWLAVVPLLALLLVAGFYVTDVSRIVANRFSEFYVENPAYHRITDICAVVAQYFPYNQGFTLVNLLIYYLFGQSLYLLGGILWPKLSFIKTFGVLQVAQLVLMPLVNNLDVCFDLRHADIKDVLVGFDIFISLLTVGAYCVTYYVMKRKTL